MLPPLSVWLPGEGLSNDSKGARRVVVGPSAEAMAIESNQTNPRSDLENGFRALPVRPTATVAPGQQRSCPCYSRE